LRLEVAVQHTVFVHVVEPQGHLHEPADGRMKMTDRRTDGRADTKGGRTRRTEVVIRINGWKDEKGGRTKRKEVVIVVRTDG
jgi:hypothetical protein